MQSVLIAIQLLALTLLGLHGRSESLLQGTSNLPARTFHLPAPAPHPAAPQAPAVPLPH